MNEIKDIREQAGLSPATLANLPGHLQIHDAFYREGKRHLLYNQLFKVDCCTGAVITAPVQEKIRRNYECNIWNGDLQAPGRLVELTLFFGYKNFIFQINNPGLIYGP